MRVLVTGASGFVGRHLCELLIAEGHEIIPVASPRGVGEYRVDLRDLSVVVRLVETERPDGVIHLAGRARPSGHEFFGELLEHNAGTTWSILEAVRRSSLSARVVVMSSSAVYGPVPREHNPIAEDQPLRPALPYGAAKVAAEAIACAYQRAGIDVVVVRPFNLAGPGQSSNFVPACFAERLASVEAGRATAVETGPLDTWRDFLDVRDLVRALGAVLRGRTGPGPYNICSGVARSGREILSRLVEMGKLQRTLIREGGSPVGPLNVVYQCGNARAIHEAVDWRPAVTWESTLKDSLADWRERVGGANR